MLNQSWNPVSTCIFMRKLISYFYPQENSKESQQLQNTFHLILNYIIKTLIFLMSTTFKEKKWKNTPAYKSQAHKKGDSLYKRHPSSTYITMTKKLWHPSHWKTWKQVRDQNSLGSLSTPLNTRTLVFPTIPIKPHTN